MARETQIISLVDDDSERVLAPHRLRRFYVFFLPLLLSFIFCGVGGWFTFDADRITVPALALFAAGILLALGYMIFETFFIGVIPARCYLRWLRERISQRPDAVVAADDPNALFVQHIPRKNWEVNIGENAADVGLMIVDYDQGLLKYEGDIERWIVPAERIHSVRLDSFTPSAGMEFLNRHSVVMLRIETDDEDDRFILRPLAVHPVRWLFWTPGWREEGAQVLREAIGHLIDPDKWPRPHRDDLYLLIPPPY